MFRSLVWKEWHEQCWRLWFGVALLATFTAIGLRTRIMPDEQIVIFTIIIGGMGLPLMVAMSLVAPERADGTIVRLLALPVPSWKVVAAKGLVGAILCTAPILTSAAIASLIAGNRELSWNELLGLYGMALGVAMSVFSWLTAVGIRQPSEARAGLMGIGTIVAWFLLIGIAAAVRNELVNISRLEDWVGAFSPLGFAVLRSTSLPPSGVIGVQLASIALLWVWSARRIGKPGKVVA